MYAKNTWEKYKDNLNEVMEYNEGYKDYISKNKTERACVKDSIRLAKEKGFKPLDSFETLKPGDKVYVNNRDKNIALFVIGNKPLTEGMRILGAHIDSPRMDLKQNPLYESEGFVLADTHYYGGVKKYQWVTIPLSLYGVVAKKDGTVVDVVIGEDDNDPVVGISDLLIHLAAEQLDKKAAKVIEGENLDVTLGNMPLVGEEKDAVKANILKLLKDKYDIEEEDFVSAEIEVVPSGKARDYGLDRSMIAGYGHDDRVCAYTSLTAILDMDVCDYTCCTILVDKEEIGSVGATGAQSLFFENTIGEMLVKMGIDSFVQTRLTLSRSKMLSSDVSAGVDPLFVSVNDKKNAAYLGNGIVFNKYTGARGKSGSNDASAEYVARIRAVMDESNIHYQTAELGKVDLGGGGTIAYILGNYNMDVIDAGIAVLNMHAPMEVVSKVDVYETYQAYKAFLKNA
ncbi:MULTISPECIES: aminopeptidase [Coprobacillaceae]|uniref:Probable M18 family aminopeptidase 1 n=1 Tax=Catenibacterium mitsuokai TaxID=100886 RepID=A0AAW4MTH2_9FIRM|nr:MULTISPECIES: aminopeptidase [Coprobacillaceae]MBV3365612.1 aminopeptidase [Catenibacterium mitsuokai]MBV3369755.1 aminopeptidase [Catenibacterium mitsuokai]MBV3375154.1 aminopeptidase [Catenibacterium mitsuokai]MBV3377131.1 aminopeptidase [Catenibacterium mitsuokai]MBV3379595.1 aminopeptidase [Catenibacterium mitsuokai]